MLLGLAVLLGLYVLLYHNFIKGTRCRNETSLRGKTVIVTGGNTGIGKATALDLARRGARVILACRNKVRGECAAYDIRRESRNNEVLFMSLDLASLNSVRKFAETFLRSEPRLDILINNADPTDGAQTSIYCATQEGIEMFSGRYFANCRLEEPKPHARDDVVAKKLWEFSERLVGITAS